MSITSEEVNYLVYRYLQESGFSHAAYSFAHEASILKNDFKNVQVSPGALVLYLQKGLLYTEIEAHTNPDGTEKECGRAFSLLQQHQCDKQAGIVPGKSAHQQRQAAKSQGKLNTKSSKDAMDVDTTETQQAQNPSANKKKKEIQDVLILSGHKSEVFCVDWAAKNGLLVSGSGDGTAKLWSIPSSIHGRQEIAKSTTLLHISDPAEAKDVTTVSWNNDGTLFSTGAYTGEARIYNADGKLLHLLTNQHAGPLFAVKWNKRSDRLVSASVDKKAIVWQLDTRDLTKPPTVLHVFECHKAPVLDVDWLDDDMFATCSTDKSLYVCRIIKKEGGGMTGEVVKHFEDAHGSEVNAIRWSPDGRYLASCSDDKVAKIWSINKDKPLLQLKEHSKEIYSLTWSPTGPGSPNPELPLLLATSSFDFTVKLWNPETGECIHTLGKPHSDAVYCAQFSSCGRFLASGSFDGRVCVWDPENGSVLKWWKGTGGIFDVSWRNANFSISSENGHSDGKQSMQLAVAFADHSVAVLEMRI